VTRETRRSLLSFTLATALASGSFAQTKAPAPAPVTAANGVVTLERGGKALGVGTVLNGDGRILSALSAVAPGTGVQARYPDGKTVAVRVGHADVASDLVLLVPDSDRVKQGLKAASVSAAQAGALQSFAALPGRPATPRAAKVRGPLEITNAGKKLTGVELEIAVETSALGTPLVDSRGEVVAIAVRGCATKKQGPCVPSIYGADVAAIKAFLRGAPASSAVPRAFLGAEGETDSAGPAPGVRVTRVSPGSPAALAGLRAGKDATSSDVIVAVDGSPVGSSDALNREISARSVGEVVDLLVFGGGRFRHLTLVLGPAPAAFAPKKKTP
jgi:S1-C subfamily serine protease